MPHSSPSTAPVRTPLASSLDHVAVAVDDLDGAAAHWDALGAVPVMGSRGRAFSNEQVRLAGGGKVELIAPGRDASFMTAYLDRFGSGRIHHITLKLDHSLDEAVSRLRGAGIEPVDVNTEDPDWHEAFISPTIVGGLIVQLAVARLSDAEFAAATGRPAPTPEDPTAPVLDRVVLAHPDLGHAGRLWTLVGGEIEVQGPDHLLVTFPGSAIRVEIRRQATAIPIGLVLQGEQPTGRSRYAPAFIPASPEHKTST